MSCTILSLVLLAVAAPPVETFSTPSTRLYVCTVPSGASVKAGGKSQGDSPCLFVVPPGVRKMTVEVELDGHYPGRKEVEVRGGRITRVQLELKPRAAAGRSGSIPAQLNNAPAAWKRLESFLVPRDQAAAIEKKLGGRIKRLWNTVFSAHGQRVQVNVIECASSGDARKVHQAVLAMKGDPAFCLRFDETVVEFVGTFDVAFAKQAAAELGLAVRLSHVDDSAEGRRSIGGSGHVVVFQRPENVKAVKAIEIFASRYGLPQPPDEDFHLYLLDGDQQVVKDMTYPYSMIERGEPRWYTLDVPAAEVPERFFVALSFNPHRTKGIYLGIDEDVAESHSYTGLPGPGFQAVDGEYGWMVRAVLAREMPDTQNENPFAEQEEE